MMNPTIAKKIKESRIERASEAKKIIKLQRLSLYVIGMTIFVLITALMISPIKGVGERLIINFRESSWLLTIITLLLVLIREMQIKMAEMREQEEVIRENED